MDIGLLILRGRLWWLVVVTLLAAADYAASQSTAVVTVNTPQGIIQGFTEDIDSSLQVARFYSIPYAQPPTSSGTGRWKKPQPVPAWGDVFVTRNDGTMGTSCIQTRTGTRANYNNSEDCLTLNVYTRAPVKSGSRKAVLVWIHGGGYSRGAATEYDGRFLAARQDILVVTINYRLGIMGYFDIDGDGLVENFAFWDMKLALEWVQNNIESFGGDKTHVTIYGGSAGGMAVTLMATSDMFTSLFHRIIGASGNFLCPKLISPPTETVRKRILEEFGCSDVDCLREKDAVKVDEYARKISADLLGTFPTLYFYAPFYEDEIIKADLFEVWRYFRKGEEIDAAVREKIISKFQSYDYLGGFNTQEGSLILTYLNRLAKTQGFTIEEGANQDMAEQFLNEYLGSYFPNSYERVKNTVKDIYFRDVSLSSDPSPEVAGVILNIFSDMLFRAPTIALLDNHSEQNTTSTYMYTFTYETHDSQSKNPSWFRGSRHTDERTFVFGKHPTFYNLPDYQMTEREVRLNDQMMEAWGNFIRTGHPVTNNSEIIWKPYTKSRQYFYEFGEGQMDVSSRMYNTRRVLRLKDEVISPTATPAPNSGVTKRAGLFYVLVLWILLTKI